MACVPVIVANRRRNCNRSRSGNACAAISLALLFFGVFFALFFDIFDAFRFNFPPIMFIGGFMVFIAIIIGISAITMSMSETYKKPKEQYLKSYSSQPQRQNRPQIQVQQYNPYINRKSIQREPEEHIYNQIQKDIPVLSDINYCRFCGAKVDRNAVFCHQCGINLSS
ncbi:MAG: hypothetical protein CEE43_16850 [Promethearchaeota archaeon Loki_b32]|nr:MAG: hypothetical protein CEE43_16850 [Candidatus Lokiarchaeota archaeon Loki_b32]